MTRGSGAIAPTLSILIAGVMACASGGDRRGTAGEASEGLQIEVRNNLRPPTEMTVLIREEGSAGTTLGTVPATSSRTFTFSAVYLGARYRLVARTSGGREIVSDTIHAEPGETMTWILGTNQLQE